MTNKPLFTVIILSYNQEKTICESISSVLAQNYENLELIITDDASAGFEKVTIQEHIDKKKRGNLKNYLILTHEQNVGTVKHLNFAIKKASGYYVTVFAGDDCLYDEYTLSNYEKAFTEHPDKNIITAQCYRYDPHMMEFLLKQVPVERAYKINESPAPVQFRMLSEWNAFAMGATAFKQEMLKKHNFFDEKYRLIEDWSLFLRLTRSGETFYYADFVALKHRYGGLSKRKSKENSFALTSRDFCIDLLAVFENEIFPYMKELSETEQNQRFARYMSFITANKNLLTNTIYENAAKVKMRFLFRYPTIAVKLFLRSRLSSLYR
jgi:GT2 family glycosyltransferase